MYMIVLMAYTIVVGQPIDAPRSFTIDPTFKNLAECQEYLKSQEFAMDRALLTGAMNRALHKRPSLDADPDDVDAAIGDTAITASCQEDTRV